MILSYIKVNISKKMKQKLCLIIYLSIIKIIFNQDCSSNPPTTRYDCFKYSTPDQFCCFKSFEENCAFVDKKKQTLINTFDCGVSEENYGFYELGEYHPRQQNFDIGFQACGEKNPSKKEDCLEYSELTNSCCFFQDANGNKACFSIGKRYTGDLKEKNYDFNGANIRYECNSEFIIFRLYFIFFMLILFF